MFVINIPKALFLQYAGHLGDLKTALGLFVLNRRSKGFDHFTDSIEVSACHLSFPENRAIEFEDILMMEEFNLRLAELNSAYCRENDISPEIRIELKQLSWR